MRSVNDRLDMAAFLLRRNKKQLSEAKYRAEMAKLKLLKQDPTYAFSNEIKMIRDGKMSLAIFSLIDKELVLPLVSKFITSKIFK